MAETWTAESIMGIVWRALGSQPLIAAVELGVFETLGGEAKTAEELAGILGTDRRATEALLNALAAAGLLDKSADAFAIPASLIPLLSTAPDTTVLPMIRHQAACAHRWDKLAEVVRTGRPPATVGAMLRNGSEQRAFIQAMHVIGRGMADQVVAVLEPTRFRRALDVGGASGTYTIALLRAAPEMRATLFDLPPVVEMARERLDAEGLLDRVDLVTGDFYKDPLPGGHDLALLSAIIHQNSSEQNRALYAKCLDTLDPGGTIVIRDIIMEDSHTKPHRGALFAINMLVNTEGGGCYSFSEIRNDLKASGFVDVTLVQQGTWMDGLVSARRP